MKLRLFAPPSLDHPHWRLWAVWACSLSRTYLHAAATLQCDSGDLHRLIPPAERPLMSNIPAGSVPVVWTDWGWLEGEFGEDGVFHYRCDMKEWKGPGT